MLGNTVLVEASKTWIISKMYIKNQIWSTLFWGRFYRFLPQERGNTLTPIGFCHGNITEPSIYQDNDDNWEMFQKYIPLLHIDTVQ